MDTHKIKIYPQTQNVYALSTRHSYTHSLTLSACTKNSLWINQSKWFLREEQNMTDTMDKGLKKMGVTVSKPILAIIAILFGILVIVFPSLLVWIVGLYFIIQGILLLLDYMELRRK